MASWGDGDEAGYKVIMTSSFQVLYVYYYYNSEDYTSSVKLPHNVPHPHAGISLSPGGTVSYSARSPISPWAQTCERRVCANPGILDESYHLLERRLGESYRFMQQRLDAEDATSREEQLVACHDAQTVKVHDCAMRAADMRKTLLPSRSNIPSNDLFLRPSCRNMRHAFVFQHTHANRVFPP